MLKFLSPSNVFIRNVLMSLLETNLACAVFNFVSNIVVGNVLVFFLEVILPHARFISPYNFVMFLFLMLKLNLTCIRFLSPCNNKLS